ncbi:signal peptidase I [bacterium]|nr:MAG: signal peptidase I [bacterium]
MNLENFDWKSINWRFWRKDKQTQAGAARARPVKRTPRETFVEYVKAIGSAVLIALVLRQFIFQAFTIPTGSMLETLQIGDFLFVNKFLYGAKTPDRIRVPVINWTIIDDLPVLRLPAIRQPRQGDIIVFEYPRNRNEDYIKRCVAVAGDTVAVREGVVYVNGLAFESNLGDPDADHTCIPTWTDPESCPAPRAKKDQAHYVRNPRNHRWPWDGMPDPYVVPEGTIFMMGDNRYNSMDSRYWGPLDLKLIKGKALFIYWSWDRDRHLPRFSRLGDLVR